MAVTTEIQFQSPINRKGAWTICQAVPEDNERVELWLKLKLAAKTPPEENRMICFRPDPKSPRYRVEAEPCAEGGASRIYKGMDRKVKGRMVAIKVFQRTITGQSLDALEVEAKTLSRIDHPHVVKVYDFVIAETPEGNMLPAIVMEYVDAPTLQEKFDSGIQFSKTEIIDITQQAAETIDDLAAKHNLFHCDLKPGSIFLADEGIIIHDFGISSWTSVNHRLIGSAAYIAPERRNQHFVDLRGEEFNLGLIVYQMISGRHPFTYKKEDDGSQVMVHIEKDPPLKLAADKAATSRWEKKTCKALDQVFAKAFAKDPDNRFQTATDFAEAVAEVLSPLT